MYLNVEVVKSSTAVAVTVMVVSSPSGSLTW